MKLSIIIPTYNERKTILEILKRIERVDLGLDKEIIIVDDCSTDGTIEILNELDKNKYQIVFKNKNEGKGASIKAGLTRARGDFVIFQDADLEYDPIDYLVLLEPLKTGKAELAIGSRVLSGSMQLFGSNRANFSSYLGCVLIAFAINLLYGREGTDYYGCYKAFRRGILENISVKANGFEYDSELLCKLFKQGVKTVEVPTTYHPRSHDAGKKISWYHGFAVLFSIVRWRFFN
ncbi:MAG: glycosyltransferase family 2 protein [Candidatus Azambacteria bacterium]|nr:glycosyltransferase family 2 protein [Candidatus Azambacteria bacterium]